MGVINSCGQQPDLRYHWRKLHSATIGPGLLFSRHRRWFCHPYLHRACPGKALFFPILNSLWGAAVGDCVPTNPGVPVPCNIAILRKSAADSMDSVTLKAAIDGEPVEDLRQQRVQSPVLTITFPNDKVLYTPNVSDGYWLLLSPLSAGKHTIYFKGEFTDGIFKGIKVEVTYNLTVHG